MDNKLDKYTLEDFQKAFPGMFDNVYCGFSLPKGWGPIVWRLCESIAEYKDCKVQVVQIKEKFGSLRFYVNIEANDDDGEISGEVYDLIHKYEDFSSLVCEACGTTVDVKSRATKGKYWMLTLCGTCRNEEADK
jgi:hypothetical protein